MEYVSSWGIIIITTIAIILAIVVIIIITIVIAIYHIHVPCETRHGKYRETVALTPFKQILTSLDPVHPQLYSIELSSI